MLDERRGVQALALVPGVVEFLGAHDALGPHDFAERPADAHLHAARFVVPHVTVSAADAKIDFALGEHPAGADAQPALEELGLRVRFEHEPARRVEVAGHRDLTLAGSRNAKCFGLTHRRFPPFEAWLCFSCALSSSRTASKPPKLPSQYAR